MCEEYLFAHLDAQEPPQRTNLPTLVRVAALLHDIGKIGIPDAILRKPGPLTEEERQIMQRHPETRYHILD